MTAALAELTERERGLALEHYHILRPHLEEGIALTQIARQHNSSIRTLRRWVKQYRTCGLAGLARKQRVDSGSHQCLSLELQQFIEGLALRRPPLSMAAIHRQVTDLAGRMGRTPPSYTLVFRVVHNLSPALVTLAHEGSKAYSERYDLICRREADGPNAVWQADHSPLDILLLRDGKEPAKPWLTTIEDDYSRAIAGYFFSFDAPSSLHTALALRQAIWRKDDPRWHICGIPGRFYTDNGSDFTSQHLEQVSADLRIRLVFSTPGQPRGRGRIERFFETVNQMLLCELPGYAPPGGSARVEAKLTLLDLESCFREFLLGVYHQRPHGATGIAPQQRWDEGGFLPQMPESLEQLDLLLLTVARSRKVHPDGIRFQGMRYMDLTLAAYIGEEVILRYDPRDMAEIRVFHQGRFLCRAICQELAGETVPLREIIQARNRHRRELRQTIKERQRTVDSLLEVRRFGVQEQPTVSSPSEPEPATTTLKRYFNE